MHGQGPDTPVKEWKNEIRAECTWGDGPPVCLHIQGLGIWTSFDLTAKEARTLGIQLQQAAEQYEELERTCAEIGLVETTDGKR